MFLTEIGERADVVFPSASAYEKDGTVTNVTGEVQKRKRALKTMGTQPDLEIFGLLAKEMGISVSAVRLRRTRYSKRSGRQFSDIMFPCPLSCTGGAAQAMPLNGRVPATPAPELIQSARDTLFTSGYARPLFEESEQRPGAGRKFGCTSPVCRLRSGRSDHANELLRH